MRTNITLPIFVFCCAGALFLSGCLDITSTSQINTNGSIVRTITFVGDSSEVYAGDVPFGFDSLWTKNISRSKEKDKNYILTASRTFRDVEEMNRVFGGTSGKTLQYRFELDKSFRWFFTVYRYQETNLPFDQFTAIPMTQFASSAEIEWMTKLLWVENPRTELATRGDSLAFDSIVPRLQEGELRNRFEGVYTAFLDGVKALNDPSLTAASIGAFKDSLYSRSAKLIDKQKVDTLRFVFASTLRSPLVEKAWRANASGIADVKRRMEFEHKTNSHKYVTNVVMPGLITRSNARKIEGNKATWQDFKDYARHFGYTVWVESRQVNWWAVIVALVVVVGLMAVLILSVLRKRTRT